MTVPLLLEHFDELISTPEDVEKLNNFILDLAVKGGLVPQNSTDEPVHRLLQKKTIENKDESKETQSSKKDKIPPLKEEDEPYVLPKRWEWARVGSIAFVTKLAGFEFTEYVSYNPEGDLPVIKGENVSKQGFRKTKFSYVKSESVKHLTRSHLHGDDLLMGFVGSVGQVARVPLDQQYFLGPNVALIRFDSRIVSPAYAELFFRSPIGFRLATSLSKATAQHSISMTQIRLTPFAIPPLAEQHRIIARVEELFVQTRALAKELTHSQSELDGLNKSALSHLLASETLEEFNQHWDFIAEHFDLLFQTPEHVAPLRQSILELAVRGKLTRREAGDESAKELLKRVRKDKKESALPLIKDSEKSYELPVGWEWVRFGEIGEQRLGKMLDGSKNKGDYYPYLRNINVQWLRIDLFNVNQMRYEPDEIDEYKLQPNDLLICEGGEPGRCAIWESNDLMMFQKAIHRVRPYNGIVSKYLLYHLWGDAGNGVLAKYFTGATIKHFTGKALANYVCALPPVAEQERIVKRVEQLLSLCDALEARLQSAEEERGKLVRAVMAGVGGSDGE